MSHKALIAEIEQWLIGKALGDPDVIALFESLCERLYAIGIPVERSAFSWPMLHPLFRAEHLRWVRGEGANLFQSEHANVNHPTWTQSPFAHVLEHNLDQLRRRLDGPDAVVDFPILEDLRDEGFTDYLLTKSVFSIAEFKNFSEGRTGVMASWSTKRENGFTDTDIEALCHVQRFLAVACRQAIQKRVMANVANTYLGPTAGWRVLSGEIQRSDGDKINAVIWFSDLRGSTALSERMEPQDYLEFLNSYFECTAGPVIEQGGEILNFIGDAVLAIFPIESEIGTRDAVRRATAAADAAMEHRATACEARDSDGERPRFGIALSVGKVMFGNIGVPERLAFSAIGKNVNAIHRIDQVTKQLGEPVLATEEVAKHDPDGWFSVGAQQLNDFENPVRLFARTSAKDRSEPAETADDAPVKLGVVNS